MKPAGGGPPRTHRTPPPEATGIESEYLGAQRENEVPMEVELLDGKTVRGIIRYFDRDMIKIEGDDGPGMFIRKRDIRHMHPVGGD